MKTPLNITVKWLARNVVGFTITLDALNQETWMFRCQFGKIEPHFAQYLMSKKESTRHRTWVSTVSYPVEIAQVPAYIVATVEHFLK